MQEQLEEKLGAIVAGRYMTLLWANAGKPRPEDAELRESIRRLVTDFHSRPLTIGLALRLFGIDPLTRPLTVHVVGASHVETLNTRLTDYDELTRMFPGHQGVEMVMVGVDVVDGPIMRPPLTTLAPRGSVYLSSYKGLYHDFWESHVETKLAAPPDLVVGFHPGKCLRRGRIRPSHPTARMGTSTGHMDSGTALSTPAAPGTEPEGGLGYAQGFAPRHNRQLLGTPGTWLPCLPSLSCLCHPPAGEMDPSLQVSVLWLRPGPRVRGARHAGGEPDPTLPRAAKLAAYSGMSSTEWMQLETAFPGARAGWERGGTLTAVSPQVSMPAQTCWQAGCPPCCCCGTIACPCSSPCTGEHSPRAPVSRHKHPLMVSVLSPGSEQELKASLQILVELEMHIVGYASNPFASLRPEQVYSSPNKPPVYCSSHYIALLGAEAVPGAEELEDDDGWQGGEPSAAAVAGGIAPGLG
ncbi:hypothetical protein Nmel_014340 [Mimus melanotis]